MIGRLDCHREKRAFSAPVRAISDRRRGAWRVVHGGSKPLLIAVVAAACLAAAGPALAATVTPVSGTTLLVGVACDPAGNCVAAGQGGAQQAGMVVPITDGTPGAAAAVANTNELYAAACPATDDCLAVGTGNDASQGAVVPITSGSPGAAELVPNTEYLRGVACATSTDCVAVGWDAASNTSGRIAVVVPITDGVAGGAETVSGSIGLEGVACPTASSCVAVGDPGPDGGSAVVVPITDGVPGGAQQVGGMSALNGVDCPSATTCFAVGEAGSGTGGGVGAVVPIADGAPGGIQEAAGATVLQGAACPTAESCVAGGWSAAAAEVGTIVPISDGVPGTAEAQYGTFQLYGVACTSSTSCLAAGDNSSDGEGVLVGIEPAPPPPPPPPPPGTPSAPSTPNKAEAKLEAVLDFVDHLFDGALCLDAAQHVLQGDDFDWEYASAFFVNECDDTVVRLYFDALIAEDPPSADYSQIASVAKPSADRVKLLNCGRAKRTRRGLCHRLDAAAGAQLAGQQQMVAVVEAIETTVARDAGAQQAGNIAAVTLQEQALAGLASQFKRDAQAAAEAGTKLVKLLRDAHAKSRLSNAISRRALAALARKLAAKGVTQSEIDKILGAGKPPRRAPNLFTILARG